jgi:large subunit ribosomal protein L9
MEIILRHDYEGLGKTGEIVRVKDGFARNYLLPKGIAYMAGDAGRNRLENDLQQQKWRQNKNRRKAEELSKKLESISCTISVQVGEEDRMFGSVTSQNIADALAIQGFEIDKRKVVLDEPIKSLGIYTVPIKLHSDVDATIKVWVVKE